MALHRVSSPNFRGRISFSAWMQREVEEAEEHPRLPESGVEEALPHSGGRDVEEADPELRLLGCCLMRLHKVKASLARIRGYVIVIYVILFKLSSSLYLSRISRNLHYTNDISTRDIMSTMLVLKET